MIIRCEGLERRIRGLSSRPFCSPTLMTSRLFRGVWTPLPRRFDLNNLLLAVERLRA